MTEDAGQAYGEGRLPRDAASLLHSTTLSGARRAPLYDTAERRKAKLDQIHRKFESLGAPSRDALAHPKDVSNIKQPDGASGPVTRHMNGSTRAFREAPQVSQEQQKSKQ